MLAQQYDVYVERASSTVLVATALSVLTLTTVMYLAATDRLPVDLFP
ncbi:hypothetical protein N177_0807 [Lutibaculum baratangense AMV1]|uniref:Uncharacterized protein n=1 Tax=Lutibaculum baratangense AMV1 TaxID=631454 RepID=V4TL92_9HYPH|nr:hypothetical protein N177_0807 [Lutibaculum baratangense AMV1]